MAEAGSCRRRGHCEGAVWLLGRAISGLWEAPGSDKRVLGELSWAPGSSVPGAQGLPMGLCLWVCLGDLQSLTGTSSGHGPPAAGADLGDKSTSADLES